MKPETKSRRRKVVESAPASPPRPEVAWSDIDLIKRHPSIVTRSGAAVVVIDMQEKLMATMRDRYELIARANLLLEAARTLSVPILLTEQYPKGLGRTDKRLEANTSNATRFEKTCFSAAGEKNFLSTLESLAPRHIVLAGIEAHVCVAQTALDLKGLGYDVAVCLDAIASRKPSDRDVAIERMRGAGITITTVEAVIFEMLEKSGGAEFKKILELVK